MSAPMYLFMRSTAWFILGAVVGYLLGTRPGAGSVAVRDGEGNPCDADCETCAARPELAEFVCHALDLHERVLGDIHNHLITDDGVTEDDLSATVAHLLEHVKEDLLEADGAFVLTFLKLPKNGVLEMFKALLARGIDHVGVEPVRAAYNALCAASAVDDVDARFDKIVREAWRPSPTAEQKP